MLALTATASAAVGIPLVRRLRSLQNAVSELGSGNWAVRLDANAEGALGELAESINRTAAQLQQQFQDREALLQVVSHEIRYAALPHAVSGRDVGGRDPTAEPAEPPSRPGRRPRRAGRVEHRTCRVDGAGSTASTLTRDFELQPVLESLAELARSGKARAQPITLLVPANVTVCADQRQFQRALEKSPAQRTALRARIRRRRSAG